MNNTVFKAGKRYERMVLILAIAFLFLCIAYAFLYVMVLVKDKPVPSRRSSFYMIIATGLFFSIILYVLAWFFEDFIRYELCGDCLRISKGRFLRVIDYRNISGVTERFTGRKYKKQYVIVLKSGTEIPVNPYVEDAEGFKTQLVALLR